MTQIKGTALLGALKFAREAGYPLGIPGLLAHLPAAVQPIFDAKIQPNGWYPYDAWAALLRRIDEDLGKGDLSAMPEVGHFAVREDVGRVLRVVSLFASVEALLARAQFFWSRTCDRGVARVLSSSAEETVLALDEFPDVSEHHCHMLVGWVEGLALAMGAHSAAVRKTSCVHRGDPRCEYHGHWT